MADNYLENKMEEHRRNPGGAPLRISRRRQAAAGVPEGKIMLDFPPLRVLVAFCPGEEETGAALVAAFSSRGCRTAFVCPGLDSHRGSALAQGSGARFCPGSADSCIAPLVHAWHGIDLVIAAGAASPAVSAREALVSAGGVFPEGYPRLIRIARAGGGSDSTAHSAETDVYVCESIVTIPAYADASCTAPAVRTAVLLSLPDALWLSDARAVIPAPRQ